MCIRDRDEDAKIYVRTEEGKDVMVEPAAWSNMRYHFNEVEKKIEEEEDVYKRQVSMLSGQSFGSVGRSRMNLPVKSPQSRSLSTVSYTHLLQIEHSYSMISTCNRRGSAKSILLDTIG